MASPLSSLNPLNGVNLGTGNTWLWIGIIVVMGILIIGGIGALVLINWVKKQYYIKIRVSRLVGNVPTEIATFSARVIGFGRAGDVLWRVAPAGIMKFKTIKWLPSGKLQSSPNLFKYWIREDGEWINYIDSNLDEISKTMGVKFVQEDMRLQRLATDRLLEQRLMEQSFWQKYKEAIFLLIFFLVFAVAIAIVLFQLSGLIDKISPLAPQISSAVKQLTDSNTMLQKYCHINTTTGGQLIPAN